jgi:hypothetical protein
MNSKSFHHKLISYGPGGYHCPCCGPNPKRRQKERKLVRNIEKRLLRQIEKVEDSFDEDAFYDEVNEADNERREASDNWHAYLESRE